MLKNLAIAPLWFLKAQNGQTVVSLPNKALAMTLVTHNSVVQRPWLLT
jgi:hypothetical protein